MPKCRLLYGNKEIAIKYPGEKDALLDRVSVVIPTHSKSVHLMQCLKSIPKGVEIIVVDNDAMLLAQKRNYGASKATREFILFCDDDNIISTEAVKNMVCSFNYHTGIMGMVGVYADDPNKICDGGSFRNIESGFTSDPYVNKSLSSIRKCMYDVDEVANVFMIRKYLFNSLNGFDNPRFPIDLDEADLCRRVKKEGYQIVMNPHAITMHHSHTYSRLPDFRRPLNAYMMGRNKVLFQVKHLEPFPLVKYFCFFLPITILGYVISLTIKKNTRMIPHFLKGVYDGLRNRTGCPKGY